MGRVGSLQKTYMPNAYYPFFPRDLLAWLQEQQMLIKVAARGATCGMEVERATCRVGKQRGREEAKNKQVRGDWGVKSPRSWGQWLGFPSLGSLQGK